MSFGFYAAELLLLRQVVVCFYEAGADAPPEDRSGF